MNKDIALPLADIQLAVSTVVAFSFRVSHFSNRLANCLATWQGIYQMATKYFIYIFIAKRLASLYYHHVLSCFALIITRLFLDVKFNYGLM